VASGVALGVASGVALGVASGVVLVWDAVLVLVASLWVLALDAVASRGNLTDCS
jgi:hypothetical protein